MWLRNRSANLPSVLSLDTLAVSREYGVEVTSHLSSSTRLKGTGVIGFVTSVACEVAMALRVWGVAEK